jgi:hypothetical protein
LVCCCEEEEESFKKHEHRDLPTSSPWNNTKPMEQQKKNSTMINPETHNNP